MHININTKIGAIIRANPAAIDAIASINAHFKKLQNPVLRKILASRVTIGDAARIGKCDVNTFFEKLKPLGFTADEVNPAAEDHTEPQATFAERYDKTLDVRADISNGNDPFRKIMQALSELEVDEVLLLINSFEPLPLICILKEKKFDTHMVQVNADEVHTYIRKNKESKIAGVHVASETDFDGVLNRFKGKLEEINVRDLPMPQPMISILDKLETITNDTALFVYHKKVPMFLLPELKERNFDHVLRHTAEGVELIIYRKG